VGSDIGGVFVTGHKLDAPESDACRHEEVLARIGQMTRTLHDCLHELGLDKLIVEAAHEIPDTRDRLNYVARLTEQAAQRVLNATDAAMPLQDKMEEGAEALSAEWGTALSQPFSEEQYRLLAQRTLSYLQQSKDASSAARQHLLDIMMAQDFQDLTGQVIKRITDVVHLLEKQLVQLLLDYALPEDKRRSDTGMTNGPQVNPGKSADAVSSQKQVDDLLGSLGF